MDESDWETWICEWEKPCSQRLLHFSLAINRVEKWYSEEEGAFNCAFNVGAFAVVREVWL